MDIRVEIVLLMGPAIQEISSCCIRVGPDRFHRNVLEGLKQFDCHSIIHWEKLIFTESSAKEMESRIDQWMNRIESE